MSSILCTYSQHPGSGSSTAVGFLRVLFIFHFHLFGFFFLSWFVNFYLLFKKPILSFLEFFPIVSLNAFNFDLDIIIFPSPDFGFTGLLFFLFIDVKWYWRHLCVYLGLLSKKFPDNPEHAKSHGTFYPLQLPWAPMCC